MTPDLTGIRLVSWDVDGTLYSLSALKRRLFFSGWANLLYLRAENARVERERRNGILTASVDERFERLMLDALARVAPSSKALQLIQELSARGIPQVILSDHPATKKLAVLGLSSCFAATYACSDFGCWKPAVEPFRQVQQRHHVAPSEHLHIGDRRGTDGEGAKRAGARFFLFRT